MTKILMESTIEVGQFTIESLLIRYDEGMFLTRWVYRKPDPIHPIGHITISSEYVEVIYIHNDKRRYREHWTRKA